MSDFFDNDEVMEDPTADGPTILVNGSHQPLEIGSNFMNAVKSTALQAGFGKFKVFLNGTEVRPSTSPALVSESDQVEIRPFDEAG